MLDYNSDSGISINVDPKSGNPKYESFEKIVTLNDYGVTVPMYVSHELIHSFQHKNIGDTYHYHAKGNLGYINVEFERMLLQDVATKGLSWAQEPGIFILLEIYPDYRKLLIHINPW